MIDKCARDLPLFSPYVLSILNAVLQSKDVSLLEESVDTFEAFCANYDAAQYASDASHVRQYDDIIVAYAAFGSKDGPSRSKTQNIPLAVRYRNAGSEAIKSLVSAESFVAGNGRQLRFVMPSILQNLYSETPRHFERLQMREKAQEDQGKEQFRKQRQSMAANRVEDSSEMDPTVAAGTAADVDERAEEEVAVLAMQSLRHIFAMDNPALLRIATQSILDFTSKRVVASNPAGVADAQGPQSQWAIDLFENACRWTQVQNRFVVLVAATDILTKSPIVEDDLPGQLVLTRVLAALLRSSITFIGLSVNDVLIGFIQHTLLLLQLGGQGSGVRPHRQQTDAVGLPGSSDGSIQGQQRLSSKGIEQELVREPSSLRKQLLDELQSAIGDLASHIYYADQISEMVSALLMRLKPPATYMPTAVSAIEDPGSAADAVAESGQIKEQPNTDGFFSFDTARMLALGAVKKIIVVANSHRKEGHPSSARNRVGVSTWDGTQWLLRDPDGRVRKAYVDALLTWMNSELERSSLRVVQEQPYRSKASKADMSLGNGSAIARRAVSNASRNSNTSMNLKAKSTFLQLLHLAIYDNALQFVESVPDLLLLHLLLVSLIQQLGVNAVRYGLPMIFRLQEDIKNMESPNAKDATGSLVHGYFWALSEFFDFDTTFIGRDIANEISRRSQLGLWLSPINVPALPLEKIATPASTPPQSRTMTETQRTQSLQPFTDRADMVESIAEAYTSTIFSPPSSPPLSPRRPMSSQSSVPQRRPSLLPPMEKAVPSAIKDQMMTPWSKEECIAEAEKHFPKAPSMSGSKNDSGSNQPGLLNVNGSANAGGNAPSPNNASAVDLSKGAPVSADGLAAGATAAGMHRRSAGGASDTALAPSVSGKPPVVKVSDLKRILETGADNRSLVRVTSNTDSESMMSAADVTSLY